MDRPTWRSDATPDIPLDNPVIVLLAGMGFWQVAQGFAYLDRGWGHLGIETFLWTAWTALGFGLGAWGRWQLRETRRAAAVLTFIAAAFALVPGFLMFNLLRWAGFSLLLVTAARAADLRTQRDFYFCVGTTVAVSLLVATHAAADWTIWFYLLPAWIWLAMALAWEYTAGVRIGAWIKLALTLGFLLACSALAVVLFAWLPKPGIGPFGFLPPGVQVENPTKAQSPDGGPTDRASGGGEALTQRAGPGGQGGTAGASRSVLGRVLIGMRQSLGDPNLPMVQRTLITTLLRWSGLNVTRASGPPTSAELVEIEIVVINLSQLIRNGLRLLWLLAVVGAAAWTLWRLRWRFAVEAALTCAWLSAAWRPTLSLRCSAAGARWLLRRYGHRRQAGWSVREHIESAQALPGPAHAWLMGFVDAYGSHRFGDRPISPQRATELHQRVAAVAELLRVSLRGRERLRPSTQGRSP